MVRYLFFCGYMFLGSFLFISCDEILDEDQQQELSDNLSEDDVVDDTADDDAQKDDREYCENSLFCITDPIIDDDMPQEDQQEDNLISSCPQEVIVGQDTYDFYPVNSIAINNITIEGDCLTVSYGASGCSAAGIESYLLDSGAVMESYPEQRTLRLTLNRPSGTITCMAYHLKQDSFSIASLRTSTGKGEVILHIEDYEESVVYSYE